MDWKDLLQQLIDLVSATAPELWRIALRQVWANVATQSFVAIICVIFTGVSVWGTKKVYKWEKKRSDVFGSILLGIFGIGGCGITTLVMIGNIIPQIINPEYYAIQTLINFVK
jgi:hypothetical protein